MRALYALAVLEGLAILALGFSLLSRTPAPPALADVALHMTEPASGATAETIDSAVAPDVVAPDAVAAAAAEAAAPLPPAGDAAPETPADAAPSGELGHVLYGSVRTSQGAPVRGVNLRLRRADDESGSQHGTWVDRASTYAFAGLTPGAWKLAVETTGCTPLEEEIAIDAGTRAQRHDIVLSTAPSVRVALVTPGGQPLRAALSEQGLDKWRIQVVATEAQPPARLPSHTMFFSSSLPIANAGKLRRESGTSGSEQPLPERFFGQLDLMKPLPLFVSVYLGPLRLASARVVPGQDEVELQVSLDDCRGALAEARLRLIDARTGQPIANAEITTDTTSRLRPEDGGEIRLQRIAGRLSVAISAEGYERYTLPIDLAPGRVDLGDVALHPEVDALPGVVLDPAGQPVPHAWVATLIRGGPALGPSTNADVKGEFTLRGLGGRRYLVHVSTEKAMGWTVVDGTEEQKKRIELHLRPTAQVAFDTRLDEFDGARVVVYEAEGHPLWTGVFTSLWKPQLMRLPAGTYEVEMHVGLGAPRRFPLEVGSSGATLVVSP